MKTLSTDEALTIYLTDRIDSSNAAQIEKELLELSQGRQAQLCLDASQLDYISSAGLRILLKLRKLAGKPLPIINVSNEVYEIFETTGFNDLLDVKKALREISVEGCPAIGEGATSVVYRLDPETIVKVFRPGLSMHMIEQENEKSKNAFLAGIPTAISYDLVRVGDSYGAVYELLNAKDLIDICKEDKVHLYDYIRLMAKTMKEMHALTVDPKKFDSVRERSLMALPYFSAFASPEEIEKIKAVFENIPESNHFLHGDCHLGNIMYQDGELMFIDISNGGHGHPIFDLTSMYSTYRFAAKYPKRRQTDTMLKDFTDEEIDQIWKVFLQTYLDTTDEALLMKAENQIQTVTAVRLLTGAAFIPGLLTEQAITLLKGIACAAYDRGLEPLCF